jgi:predicted RNase H-like HicB family nuclease
MATRTRSKVDEYLELPYEIAVVRRDGEDGMGWTAHVEELVGCEARGRTEEEALRSVRAVMAEWFADALANDRPVPPPRGAATHSGRLLVRMPQSLHADLARLADRERVSLNALIVGILGAAAAWRQSVPPPAPPREEAATGPTAAPPREKAPAPGTGPDRARLLALALRVNVVVVAVASVVAVALLIAALTA